MNKFKRMSRILLILSKIGFGVGFLRVLGIPWLTSSLFTQNVHLSVIDNACIRLGLLGEDDELDWLKPFREKYGVKVKTVNDAKSKEAGVKVKTVMDVKAAKTVNDAKSKEAAKIVKGKGAAKSAKYEAVEVCDLTSEEGEDVIHIE